MCSLAAWFWTMMPRLPALLCLGLYLSQIRAQNETLPMPQIIFETGGVIPVGMPVSIRCRGPPEAQLFLLQKEEDLDFMEGQHPVWNEVLFSFPKMKHTMAGIYSCVYQTRTAWSPPSESMNLAVAGVLPKPFLSVKPGTKVAPGRAVSFKCWSENSLDRLIVYQDKGFIPPMYRLAPDSEIELMFPRVSAKHGGVYSCIGFVSSEPLMWSVPSDPLVLTVSQSQDYTVGSNILVALGTLLSQAWIS
ncbi:platelet glycoprotein VI-like isoform X2 [Dromiciops gliroides]|uniref:platelet glycoprotein VI-like isoform X2 n=1 Tax=Dromiciops gliroides TaxID=33562 RepID=UPI001CC471BC|nr:platelet glycoprotein VI-like isoform X2 [Dromiciops gliroides]